MTIIIIIVITIVIIIIIMYLFVFTMCMTISTIIIIVIIHRLPFLRGPARLSQPSAAHKRPEDGSQNPAPNLSW